MFTSFVCNFCSQISSRTFGHNFVHNFCLQLLFKTLVQHFCSQILHQTHVHETTPVHNYNLKIIIHNSTLAHKSLICEKLIFTIFVHNSPFDHNFCPQPLFTPDVHNFCSQLINHNSTHYNKSFAQLLFTFFCSQLLFETFVHIFCLQLLFTIFVQRFCLQI